MPINVSLARQEVLSLMQRLEAEPAHVQQVSRLSLQLFDGLAILHQLGEDDRLVLECAALLHDIGWATADRGKDHHKESARLIRRERWQHFNPDQTRVVSQVARYHRKALPCPEHEEFTALPPDERKRVELLAGLLRLADALDRSHRQLVASVLCRVDPTCLAFEIFTTGPIDRELASVQRKADLVRLNYEREITFIVVTPPGPGAGPSETKV